MSEDHENRMLFDLRGRRKRVIQVIYVILAVLMAASLLVIGMPGGLNPFSSGGGVVSQDAADLALKRADNLEQKLQGNPSNENAQVELIRARITAGNSLVELDDNGQQRVGDKATAQYDLAAETWNKYLKTSKNPDPSVALLMANTFFSLSQGSTVAQFKSNIDSAVQAQQVFADNAVKESKTGGQNPTGALTTLAMYQYYAQDFKAADASRKQALAHATGETEKKQIENQLSSVEKDAKRIGKLIKQAEKQAKQGGKQALDNPLGGLGSGNSLGGATAP